MKLVTLPSVKLAVAWAIPAGAPIVITGWTYPNPPAVTVMEVTVPLLTLATAEAP